jgi:hypothetical protein
MQIISVTEKLKAEVKENKLFQVSVQHNTASFLFIFILTTSFGQLTIIRSSLQYSEQGVFGTNSVLVIWHLIKLTTCIEVL